MIPSVKLRSAFQWLKRPRTALVIGPIGIVVGLVILVAGLINVFGGSSDEVSSTAPELSQGIIYEVPEGGPTSVPGPSPEVALGISYLVPQEQYSAGFRMSIEALDVNAQVVELGLGPRRAPQVPNNGANVAWYDFSVPPGEGGNAVFTGHVSWARTPGVFYDLEDLEPGDIIRLRWLGGRELVYEVSDNFTVDPDDPDSLQVMSPTPTDMITLITCGGTWLTDADEPLGGSFSERVVVQANLVEPSLSVPVPGAISDS